MACVDIVIQSCVYVREKREVTFISYLFLLATKANQRGNLLERHCSVQNNQPFWSTN